MKRAKSYQHSILCCLPIYKWPSFWKCQPPHAQWHRGVGICSRDHEVQVWRRLASSLPFPTGTSGGVQLVQAISLTCQYSQVCYLLAFTYFYGAPWKKANEDNLKNSKRKGPGHHILIKLPKIVEFRCGKLLAFCPFLVFFFWPSRWWEVLPCCGFTPLIRTSSGCDRLRVSTAPTLHRCKNWSHQLFYWSIFKKGDWNKCWWGNREPGTLTHKW